MVEEDILLLQINYICKYKASYRISNNTDIQNHLKIEHMSNKIYKYDILDYGFLKASSLTVCTEFHYHYLFESFHYRFGFLISSM
jgi:hypothetical protein